LTSRIEQKCFVRRADWAAIRGWIVVDDEVIIRRYTERDGFDTPDCYYRRRFKRGTLAEQPAACSTDAYAKGLECGSWTLDTRSADFGSGLRADHYVSLPAGARGRD